MYYDYPEEEFYPESEYQEQIDALKEAIKSSVKSEILEEMNRLRAENEKLQGIKEHFEEVKKDYEKKKDECDRIIRNAEYNAKKMRLADLMKDHSKKDKNVTETDKNDTESRENVLESEESETGNPLLDAEVIVCDVMNGTKTEKLGEYAYITVPLETMKKVTMEQYDEFCDQKVQDSGYNWVTIDFGNGSGLQFQGSTPAVATYGTLDNEECIEESKGTVMMTGENTYEHSENQ